MELFVLGTSHQVAPTGVRERLHVDLDEVYETLARLVGDGVLDEAAPLATCGRLEVYACTARPERAVASLRRLVARRTGVGEAELAAHSFVHRGEDAARHLFRVAAGLDSVVHGEAQILGQVRDALNHPATARTAGPALQRLFQCALTAGKRVRTETEIGRGAASLAGAALSLIQREVGSLEGRAALVIGAGDTGTLVARLLRKAGAGDLVVANRTIERARSLAADVGGRAAGLDDLRSLVAGAELIVGAVLGVERILTPAHLNGSAGSTTRFLLDLSHPRAFDPALGEVEGVRLFDLEHVSRRVAQARESRRSQVPRAEAIVSEESEGFVRWLRGRGSVAVLRAVREDVLRMARDEADRLARGRSEEECEEVRRLARSLARSLLHRPTVTLREADPSSLEGRWLLESAASLFGVASTGDRDAGLDAREDVRGPEPAPAPARSGRAADA